MFKLACRWRIWSTRSWCYRSCSCFIWSSWCSCCWTVWKHHKYNRQNFNILLLCILVYDQILIFSFQLLLQGTTTRQLISNEDEINLQKRLRLSINFNILNTKVSTLDQLLKQQIQDQNWIPDCVKCKSVTWRSIGWRRRSRRHTVSDLCSFSYWIPIQWHIFSRHS